VESKADARAQKMATDRLEAWSMDFQPRHVSSGRNPHDIVPFFSPSHRLDIRPAVLGRRGNFVKECNQMEPREIDFTIAMLGRELHCQYWKQTRKTFIARCAEVDVSAEGESIKAAINGLVDAVFGYIHVAERIETAELKPKVRCLRCNETFEVRITRRGHKKAPALPARGQGALT